MPRFVFWGIWVFFVATACSSDDDDDDPATTMTWWCFEGSTDCWCVELTPGNTASSGDPKVDRCSYTNCVTYHEGDARHCECQPNPITSMSPFWENPMPAAACPLE